MKHINLIFRFCLTVFVLFSIVSCRKDFVFQPSTGGLEFSRDTVYLDTVFTNIGSATYTLKVYNRSNNDISIPVIKLGQGLDSKYRMTVDGMVGNNNRIFQNVELLARDSMFIFIETTFDINSVPDDFSYLYTDFIEFQNISQAPQKVELVTLIKDAYFLFPKRDEDGFFESIPLGEDQIYGFFLDENDEVNGNELIWNNTKPYVIYGYAAVPANKTLIVEAGARVHFHANSGLIAFNNSSIKVQGAPSPNPENPLENEVIFQGDRLENLYDRVPGQWGFIWLTQGSTDHEFEHVTIKNATVGLYVTGHTNYNNINADVRLKNVRIFNSANMGVLSFTGYISGENVVINAAGEFALACAYGGKYNFNHCTFNNNWPSSRQVSVFVSNVDTRFSPPSQNLVEANFHNSIIYGTNSIAMSLAKADNDDAFNYFFDHCLIRFNNVNNQFSNNPLYQFGNPEHYNECLIATNGGMFVPDFLNVTQNRLEISDESAAKEQSNIEFSQLVPFDITNRPRPSSPATKSDLGAFQSQVFETD
jgi:hypothetical protein